MKKKVALVLIAFMILIQSCVFAQNEQTFEVDALDVFSKVDGEGYHDEAGMSFDAPQFSNLGCVILHGGDWVKYDLSSFPAGTYSLTAKIANKYATNLEVEVDDVALVKAKALNATGDYSSFEEITLENFYLSENTSYLTFNNVGSMGLYLDCFELTLLSDDNVLPIKIGATDVIPGGQGTGYSDSSGSGTLEVSGQTVCIRTGEWLAYSLPMDSEAVYKLYIKAATKYGANYDVYVNDTKQITNKLLESTGDYTTHKEHEVGYITLDEGENIIKIYSTSANASYFEAILFERVADLECEAVVGNKMTDSGLVARGSSSLFLTFSNELSMSEITKENVVITDESGKELKCFAVVDENKKILKVILNDSLSFGEEYTVTLSDFIDGAGQILSNQQISFATGNEDDEGLASLEDVSVTYENGHLKACGQVVSDSDVGINGRNVKLSAKAPGTDEEITWKETLSFYDEEKSKDGMFAFEYLFKDEAESGKYTIYLDTEYNKEKYEADIYYYNADFNDEILSEMSNVKDRDALLSKLMTYGVYLDIDVEAFQSQIGDFGYVLDGMLNRKYKKADEIVNDFYGSFYLEKINQAESKSDISNVLGDSEIRELFGIDETKWILAENKIEDVASVLYESERYATIEDLKEEIVRIIDEILLDEYSVEIPEISVESKKVNIGQIASLKIELLKPIENVSEIGITLKYTSDEKELYENTPLEIVDDDFEVKRKNEDFVHSYVITKKDGALFTLEDKIITLKFTAGSDLLGEYPCMIDGYAEFQLPEMPENVTIRGNFKNAVNAYIEVEKTEKKEYSGSGGSVGKGYGSSSGGKGNEPAIIPPENEPPKEEIKAGFNDLESVKWAEESILYLADKGIVNGKTQDLFMPNDLCTRAEICKMLSLALRLSEEGGDFTDVKESDWYYSYVKKMANANIIKGYSDGTFAPNSFITREDLAVIAKRVLEYKNVEMPQAFDEFDDDNLISDYAKESVGLMKEMGILNGVGDNMFSPKTNVSRAMAAKVIYSIMTY